MRRQSVRCLCMPHGRTLFGEGWRRVQPRLLCILCQGQLEGDHGRVPGLSQIYLLDRADKKIECHSGKKYNQKTEKSRNSGCGGVGA